MRGIAHCSTHHTRGRALFERQASPPHCQRKPKAGKPRLQALTERDLQARRELNLGQVANHKGRAFFFFICCALRRHNVA